MEKKSGKKNTNQSSDERMIIMKKWSRTLLTGVLLVAVLAMAGCGEQEKYNKAKNEVVTMMQEAKTMKVTEPTNEPKDSQAYKDQYKENFADLQKKHDTAETKIQGKLTEMKEYAKKETALNNDLLQLRKQVKDENETWQQVKDIEEETSRISNDWSGSPSYDPWASY